jgi:hypothetical protein
MTTSSWKRFRGSNNWYSEVLGVQEPGIDLYEAEHVIVTIGRKRMAGVA